MATKKAKKTDEEIKEKEPVDEKEVEEVETPKKKRKMSEKTKELNALTFEAMTEYIVNNHPEDKAWFKSVAIIDGKYQHLTARKEFVNKYRPDLAPTGKKPTKADLLKDW